ncbi:MAG: winged helix-turn-helix transcriptional regulator [Planctomycetes bacterium]|nr:winged helix-turn-helix transcriptional regulator [Planctomycetota bacterium]
MLNTFVDVTLRELDRTAGLVWLVLYRDTKPDGLAQTAQADIASRVGVTPRTVRTALKRLEACELLTVVCRGGLKRGPSIYRVRAVSKNRN